VRVCHVRGVPHVRGGASLNSTMSAISIVSCIISYTHITGTIQYSRHAYLTHEVGISGELIFELKRGAMFSV
jgi:hypothetical protein